MWRSRRRSASLFLVCFLQMMLPLEPSSLRAFSMQHTALGHFPASGEAARMTKYKALDPNQRKVAWRRALIVQRFKYLGVLFTTEGMIEHKSDGQQTQ